MTLLSPPHFKDEEAREAAGSRAETKSSSSKSNILCNRVVTIRLEKRRNLCDSHSIEGVGRTKLTNSEDQGG